MWLGRGPETVAVRTASRDGGVERQRCAGTDSLLGSEGVERLDAVCLGIVVEDVEVVQFRQVSVVKLDTDSVGRVVVRVVRGRKCRERELQQRVRQQEVVADLGQRALEGDDVDDLMAEAAERVADVLGNDYCKVLDLDAASEELLLRQGVGWDGGVVGRATVSAVEADSQAASTLASREPVVVEDLATESRFSGPELLTDHDVRSGISVVIGSQSDPCGILGTHDTDERTFDPHTSRSSSRSRRSSRPLSTATTTNGRSCVSASTSPRSTASTGRSGRSPRPSSSSRPARR